MFQCSNVLRKLLPQTLGGPQGNYWNMTLGEFFARIITEHKAQAFIKLVTELQPSRIMEIGVARGWGAERMLKAAGVGNGRKLEYYGFSLFNTAPTKPDPTYPSVPKDEVITLLVKLGVATIGLFEGDSRETLPRVVPTLPKMDFIYIDGGHSYEVCKSDWRNIQPLMHPGTVVVFDDYSVRGFGVGRVVSEITGCDVWPLSNYRVAVRRLA